MVAVETVLGGCCPMGMVAVETDPSAFGEGARGLSLIVFLAAEEAMAGVAAGTRFSVPVSVLRSFSGSFSPPLSLLGVFSLMFSIPFFATIPVCLEIRQTTIRFLLREYSIQNRRGNYFFCKKERNIQKICYFTVKNKKISPFLPIGKDEIMETPVLNKINHPADLKELSPALLAGLCSELRGIILDTVSRNGGHLAPNLGIVELTVALHRVFRMPEDKIIWDVGHQSYVHKLLTGRKDRFSTIRTDGGLSGFPLREESEYDCFSAGHAGTAISAAMGFAAARDARNGKEHVIAVIGDGSLACGLSLEALNNVRTSCKNLIIILNDNKMSISKSVGAIPNYLNRIITGRSYNHFKAFAKMAVRRMPSGAEIIGGIQKLEEATKSLFVPGVFFEEMGLRYIGPINGHKLPELIETFTRVRDFNRPVIVHVITEKGAGCEYAKEAPEKFHGVSSFNPHTGHSERAVSGTNFSAAFGEAMMELAGKEPDLVAITAAMRSGTGLLKFSGQFPERFFDVGIAEEHALTFAGGLAAGGMRPVVALYATFLQRALDGVFHDICLQNLPVVICADRAGIVEDGPTHHGIYDESFLLAMPHLSVLAPKNETELKAMLCAAYNRKAPVVIRYPRGASELEHLPVPAPEWGKAETVRDGSDLAIWAVGREVGTALAVADRLGFSCRIVNARFLKPFDRDLFLADASRMPVFTIEDNLAGTGLDRITDSLLLNEKHCPVHHFAWPEDEIIPHGTLPRLREKYGMTPEAIAGKIRERLKTS